MPRYTRTQQRVVNKSGSMVPPPFGDLCEWKSFFCFVYVTFVSTTTQWVAFAFSPVKQWCVPMWGGHSVTIAIHPATMVLFWAHIRHTVKMHFNPLKMVWHLEDIIILAHFCLDIYSSATNGGIRNSGRLCGPSSYTKHLPLVENMV